jgi:putative membrane protein
MILQSLSGVPAFLVYLVVAAALLAAYVVIYTAITRHDEFTLIRGNVPGAAVALGLSAIGFALPLTSAIGHSANVIDCAIWGVIALIVQIAVYYLVRLSIPGPVGADPKRRAGSRDLAWAHLGHARYAQRRLDGAVRSWR